MNKNYTCNYSVSDFCKYLHCNNDQLNSDIKAEEMMKAVKHLKNKKVSGLVMR
jgi:hypothetical protein